MKNVFHDLCILLACDANSKTKISLSSALDEISVLYSHDIKTKRILYIFFFFVLHVLSRYLDCLDKINFIGKTCLNKKCYKNIVSFLF